MGIPRNHYRTIFLKLLRKLSELRRQSTPDVQIRSNELLLNKGNNLHAIMPRQHSANLISTRPFSTHWPLTVTMKGCFQIAFSVVILLYGVGANFPCKSEQIHWNDTVGKRYKCLDCPDCFSGLQPSVACGSSVKYGTPVDCIPCTLGKTYSDKYDKSQCKACTICSKGKAVKNNCTLFANTKCDNKCGHGFYPVPLIFGCLTCSQCCDDGKDEAATECKNYKKKCKVRSTPCIHVRTTPSKTTRHSYNTSSTLPTTQTVPFKKDMTTMRTYEEENRIYDGSSLSMTPTWSLDNEMLRREEEESGKQDGSSIVVILFVVVIALCLVLFVLMIIKKVRDMLRSSTETIPNNRGHNIAQGIAPPQPSRSTSPHSSGSTSPFLSRSGGESAQLNGSPQHDGSAPPQPNPSKSPHPNGSVSAQSIRSAQLKDKSNPGDVTLEELEKNHLSVFDWMCKELDNRSRRGTRWDFESLASQYDEISLTIRNSLRNEFQSERGSPSDVLMSHIKTKYPDHPLRHLVRNLQSIGRNDIAQKLKQYMVRKGPSSSQCIRALT